MKFSIRDLLLVTVIVALAVGWWVDRASFHATIEKLDSEMEQWKEAARHFASTLRRDGWEVYLDDTGGWSLGHTTSAPPHRPKE